MLQQTTVSTVQNKLPTILKEFPDFKSFKSKKIDDFLKCWSGLGYYNRAINFYKSVSIINKNFKGILPEDKNFYSYLFTGGGAKIKNFQNYFRSKFGHDIQILEPPSSSGIPRVLNDSSFMSVYCAYWLQSHKALEKEDFLKKIDSFSNKIWYKRFVDLL